MPTWASPSARRRPLCTYTLDADLVEGLERLRQRDGTSASESVRRALRVWLNRKGILTALPDEPLPWDSTGGILPSAEEERALDEADLELLLRALRRIRVGAQQEGRRRRLVSQLEREIAELIEQSD